MTAQTVAIIRGILVCVAVLFSNGVIPTNVDGGGRKVGDALMVIAVTLAAGQKNDEPVK
jgi:hypothetical protein